MADFAQYTVNGLTAGAFYALVALGYTIIYGIIRLINFAHGDLTMTGAFIGCTAVVAPLWSDPRAFRSPRSPSSAVIYHLADLTAAR